MYSKMWRGEVFLKRKSLCYSSCNALKRRHGLDYQVISQCQEHMYFFFPETLLKVWHWTN